ncbi:MAG: AcrB/AcrD/AcrF family protein, partial [Sphingobium yanoikuyae]
SVDSGQIAMHIRVPVGARIEDTAARFDQIGREVRKIIPADQLGSITDNIGLPVSSINTVYNNSGTIGPQDGDMLIALNKGHRPTDEFVSQLRRELPRRFPGTTFAFLPADITSQILNFGAPAPIDIQQPGRAPQLDVDVDRSRVGQYGLTERDVTTSLASSLAGTSQTAPVFFVNPQNGVQYPVVAQAPEYLVGSMSDLSNVPVSGAGASAVQPLGGLSPIV